MMKALKNFAFAWVNPNLVPTAFKVSLVVGSILFSLNHGSALIKGNLSRDRAIAGLLTYLIPYSVSIHGQASTLRKTNN